MIVRQGNMWDDTRGEFRVVLATTCSVVSFANNPNGELVMGAGSARQLAERYPHTPELFAQTIQSGKTVSDYGFLWHPSWLWGAFQTKRHFRDDSRLDVIALSTGGLLSAAIMYPSFTFHLPYPGVGYGNLSSMAVAPIIDCLPDNVHVWEYGDKS